MKENTSNSNGCRKTNQQPYVDRKNFVAICHPPNSPRSDQEQQVRRRIYRFGPDAWA
jgi:hypothetical protein